MIAYHGTPTKKNAESIKQRGFKIGSYFAYRIEDALAFGGRHLFKVLFSDDPSNWRGEPDGWQFWTRETIPPTAIVSYGAIEEEAREDLVKGLRDMAQGKTKAIDEIRSRISTGVKVTD